METQAQHLRFMLGAGEALGMAAVVRECVGENSRAELGAQSPWRCSLLAPSATEFMWIPQGWG